MKKTSNLSLRTTGQMTRNRQYFNNSKIKVGEYELEITRTATVYWVNTPGRRKLDSLMA